MEENKKETGIKINTHAIYWIICCSFSNKNNTISANNNTIGANNKNNGNWFLCRHFFCGKNYSA